MEKDVSVSAESIDFTRINNDTNGNPRFVCHYLEFITQKDRDNRDDLNAHFLQDDYKTALKRAKKLGGGKFHNKQYGGGIVFQTHNTDSLESDILNLITNYK